MERKDERFLDSGLQAAYCELHGLHYNPSLPGCALCMRSRSSSGPGNRSLHRMAPVALLIVLILAALWYFNVGVPLDQSGEVGSLANDIVEVGDLPGLNNKSSIGGLARLHAESYRTEIGGVESVLYQSFPIRLEDVSRLERAARLLAEKIRTTDPHAVRQQLGQRIFLWSARVDEELGVGYGIPELSRARSEWESIRGELFGQAEWFRKTDATLIEAQKPAPPAIDGRVLRVLQGVEADLRRLVKIGRNEASGSGEVLSEVETSEVSIQRAAEHLEKIH